MKKIISLLLCLLLISSVAFTFISCGETENPPVDPPADDVTPDGDPEETESYEDLPADERALKLDELSTEKMESISSYTFTTSGEMKFTMMNTEVNAEISGKEILLSTNSTYRHHTENRIKMNLMGVTMETKEILGFYNGTAYVSEEGEGNGYAFCSALTADDYIAYIEGFTEDAMSEFTAENAAKRSSKRTADGGWTLTFSDFSKSALNDLAKILEGFSESSAPDDASVKIILDSDLYYESFSLDFQFGEGSDFEKFGMTVRVADIDSDDVEFPEIDLTEYTEISDIRTLDILDEALKEVMSDGADGEMKEAELTLTQRQVNNGQIASAQETDKISYGILDGKYTYLINATVVNSSSNRVTTTKYVIDYKNGTKSIEQYNYKDVLQGSSSEESNDETERAFINGLLNQMKYDKTLILTMETDSRNSSKIIITTRVPEELISGVDYYSAEMTYEITFDENGDLKKLSGELAIKLNASSTQTYTIKSDCVFGKAE